MATRLRSSTRASTVASESLAETMSEIKSTRGDTKKAATYSQSKPLRKDELVRLRKIALIAFVLSNLFLYAVYYASVNDKIQLYPNSLKADSLKGFTSRAEFALRYQSLLLFWLQFNICAVIYVRLSTKALNPLVESTEKHALSIKNILTNSFEQILLSVIAQLAFVSFADPSLTLKLIPAINLVQFIGRVAFFVGYPMYRTFGFNLTLVPNLLLILYNLYRLGLYAQFY